jgi:hypothetical protein
VREKSISRFKLFLLKIENCFGVSLSLTDSLFYQELEFFLYCQTDGGDFFNINIQFFPLIANKVSLIAIHSELFVDHCDCGKLNINSVFIVLSVGQESS